MEIDPYKAQPGPELDAVLHSHLMELDGSTEPCPPYSTDDEAAKRVVSRLKKGRVSVIVGRTNLEGRSWFARYEKNAMDGTEVFANTFPLAICRLALLRIEDIASGK